MTRSKFIIVEHDAKKARLHWDVRFRMPKKKIWASFAVRKGVPLKPGKKVLAVRTHDHTEKEALFLGTIKSGYGAGKLKKWDEGTCIIHKFGPGHILVDFKGRKVKGIYHFISTGVMDKTQYKRKQYMLFKGKMVNENYPDGQGLGMGSRIPPGDTSEVESSDEEQDKITYKKLPWDRVNEYLGMISRIPSRGMSVDVDSNESEQEGKRLPWSNAKK